MLYSISIENLAYVEMLRNQQSNAISPEELDIIDTKNDKSSNKQKSSKRMFCYIVKVEMRDLVL